MDRYDIAVGLSFLLFASAEIYLAVWIPGTGPFRNWVASGVFVSFISFVLVMDRITPRRSK